MKWSLALALFLAVFYSTPSFASQTAEITEDEVEVHQLPNRGSPQVATLKKGEKIPASSGMVKDTDGSYWYKVRIKFLGYGYVQANSVDTSELKAARRLAGIGRGEESVSGSSPWNFVIRGMGLVGSSMNQGKSALGGDLEVTSCVLLFAEGFTHRLLSLGGSFLPLSTETVFAGSVVMRIYTSSDFEPEIRLRLGQGSSSGFMGGGNFGLSYPLGINPSYHFALYFEVGSLVAMKSGGNEYLWGSTGIGLHF